MFQDNKDKMLKVVNHATNWVASTHHYFEFFSADLSELKKLIKAHSKGNIVIKDLERSLSDFKQAARSEKKLQKIMSTEGNFNLEAIYPSEDALKMLGIELSGSVTDLAEKVNLIANVSKRLRVEGGSLIRMASFFSGEMKSSLVGLELLIEQYKKIRGDNEVWDVSIADQTKLSALEQQIVAQIEQLETVVTNADQWVKALTADLGTAKNIYKDFAMKTLITPKSISAVVARFSDPEEKIRHLAIFLKPKSRAAFSNAVNTEVTRLIGVLAKGPLCAQAAEAFSQVGMKDYARKYWGKAGDYEKGSKRYEEAAVAYEKAELWNDAGDMRLLIVSPGVHNTLIVDPHVFKAADDYVNAGKEGYYIVGLDLMKRGKDVSSANCRWYEHAALMFQKGGKLELAAKAFIKAAEIRSNDDPEGKIEDYEYALERYKQLGGHDKEVAQLKFLILNHQGEKQKMEERNARIKAASFQRL